MEDIKDTFRDEFNKTCDLVEKRYNKSEENRDIVGTIVNKYLHQLQCDIEKMDFLDFYKKYLVGTLYLNCDDFTNKQIIEIINESPLNERDKQLALLYWIDNATEDVISQKLQIDRKTTRTNIPKISMMLKQTASKLYK